MNQNQLLSREEVLQRLGIGDFRHIKQDKLIEFVSMIPDMDKDVAIKCVEQFPEFRNYAQNIVMQLNDVLKDVMNDGKHSTDKAVAAYQQILDDLSARLNSKKRISRKERQQIVEQMIEVADKIADLTDKHHHFLNKIVMVAGTVGSIALGVAGALLGLKIIGKK